MYSILILLVHMTYSFNKLCYLLVISVAEALSVSLVNLFVLLIAEFCICRYLLASNYVVFIAILSRRCT